MIAFQQIYENTPDVLQFVIPKNPSEAHGIANLFNYAVISLQPPNLQLHDHVESF